jgi:hypothetical protein
MSKTKLEITEAVFNELPEHSKYRSFTVEQSMFKWWVSGRSGQGLRLSSVGYDAFTEASIAHYKFPLFSNKTDLTGVLNNPGSYALSLNKKIKCPFYILMPKKKTEEGNQIILYDDKIAMWITLYGTLQEYLDSSGYK